MTLIEKNEVFVILPAFNEEPVIKEVINQVKDEGFGKIIVVNDGSRDNTQKKALETGVKVISHLINRGQGASVATGIEYVKKMGGKYVIIMDSDGQFFASDIKNLILKMEKTNADIIIGSRFLGKNKIPFLKVLFNLVADVITFILSGYWLSDTQTGFRMLGPKALSLLDINTDRYEFCSDMIRVAGSKGLKIAETSVKVRYYEYASKKGQHFGTGIETFFKLMVESLFR